MDNMDAFVKENNSYYYYSPNPGFSDNKVGPYNTLGDAVEDYCMHFELVKIAHEINCYICPQENFLN